MKKTAVQALEDQIMERAARQMAEDIDQGIMFDLLQQMGWTRVELASKWLPVTGIELHEWREANLTGHWRAHNNVWMFENKNDAALFKLTWS